VGQAVAGHSIRDADVAWQAILGYLNFSEGRPDPRFQKQLNDAYASLALDASAVVPRLADALRTRLRQLHAEGAAAFKDVTQAEAALAITFDHVLPAYRQHHADLLAHQMEAELFQPFFIARACECVLAQGGPWSETRRIAAGALNRLNDFVGYRPLPVLETRPRGEPYAHERIRPIPIYLRGAGVAWGRYHEITALALKILETADPGICAEAQFELALMDELACDPRAYDHGHPANRRPNYVFGEWDPHHIDSQGRYRRMVLRQLTLDLLLRRVREVKDRDPAELMWEAGAVLACVVLMAAGTTGYGPGAYDSSATFSTLVPRIAAYRDGFYRKLIDTVGGPHGDRLRHEASHLKQPFAGARRHVNLCMAQHRAAQLQQRYLALLLAEMGHPEASRHQAARIPTPSVRLHSEVMIRITLGNLDAERGRLDQAAAVLPEIEDCIKRGIGCGAFVDPWNILGFQGLFPLSPAREDAVRDHRVDELIYMVERLFDLHGRLLGEAAAARNTPLAEELRAGMRRLAEWWDPFATTTVNDVRRLNGAEATEDAEHVAAALAIWKQQGEAAAGLPFWKQYAHQFQTPKAFALVVGALLDRSDHKAALALLMSWLSQAGLVALEDGHYSFHALARRWLLAVAAPADGGAANVPLVHQFFDLLEVNADDYADVPALENAAPSDGTDAEDAEDDNPYRAAYEDVTYRDSGDDGNDSALADDPAALREFALEDEAPRLEKRLRFLAGLAQFWQIAARQLPPGGQPAGWLNRARANRQKLTALMEAVQRIAIPDPIGTVDAIEYDRRRGIKERLLETIIGAWLETALAIRILVQADDREDLAEDVEEASWAPASLGVEQALWRGEAETARALLPGFLEDFRLEPLLFTPLANGGQPLPIGRARLALAVLRVLLQNLPRLGLLRETLHLLRTIRAMEESQPAKGPRRVTEFDRLFRLGLQGVMESLIESAGGWDQAAQGDAELVGLLRSAVKPFHRLWTEHAGGLHLSSVERISSDDHMDWLRDFIQRYGHDLFHTKFMTMGNLRGILARGIGPWLDQLREEADPLKPVPLLDDLDGGPVTRDQATRWLEVVLQALVENYEEFKDYNSTTAQSDYGENLHVLLDFLRVKAGYERLAWQFRPLVQVHEILARQGRTEAARLWEIAFAQMTAPQAETLRKQLAAREALTGLQLRTIRDRLDERFVKPLAVERLCVLLAPALDEARQGGAGPALARFLLEVESHAATPSGSGLDVPDWLERLHKEVRRLRAERAGHPARDGFLAPRKLLSVEQVQEQTAGWDSGEA